MIYAKEINNEIRIFRQLPDNYKIGSCNYNLSTMDKSVITSEEFYELIVPELQENQLLINEFELIENKYYQQKRDLTSLEINKIESDKIKADKIKLVYANNVVIWQGKSPDGTDVALVMLDGKKTDIIEII